jgi:hypothetical protein
MTDVPDGNTEAFSKLDAGFIRVLEDVIDVLIARGVLRMSDLPVEAQRKINARKSRRTHLKHLNLLDDDSGI